MADPNPEPNPSVEGVSLEQYERAAIVLRCLGHSLRLQIVDLLDRKGEHTVGQVSEALNIPQSLASRHLIVMKDKGIVSRRRKGTQRWYSIEDMRVHEVLECARRLP